MNGRGRMNLLAASTVLVFATSLPKAMVQQSATGPALLLRAQAWAGLTGPGHIRTLWVQGDRVREPEGQAQVDAFEFKLMAPNRFQQRTGRVIHTLNGDQFWQDPKQTEAVTTAAKRSAMANLTTWSTVFLLDPMNVAANGVTSSGKSKYSELPGEVIRIQAGGSSAMEIVIDPKSGRPVGYALAGRLGGQDGTMAVRVARFEEYRTIDGRQFPMVIDERIAGTHTRLTIKSVRVNEGVTAADFAKAQ